MSKSIKKIVKKQKKPKVVIPVINPSKKDFSDKEIKELLRAFELNKDEFYINF